jgi:hypothetical protein
MKKIIFKAPAGKVTIGSENREASDLDRAMCTGVTCQEDFVEYSDYSDYLESGIMSFVFENGILYNVTTYVVIDGDNFSDEDIEQIEGETIGQWSNGIGEGFEQNAACMFGDEKVFISPYLAGAEVETIII